MPTLLVTPLTQQEAAAIDANRAAAMSDMFADKIAKLQEDQTGPETRPKIVALIRSRKAELEPAVQTLFSSILGARNPSVSVPQGATVSRQTVDGRDCLVVTS